MKKKGFWIGEQLMRIILIVAFFATAVYISLKILGGRFG